VRLSPRWRLYTGRTPAGDSQHWTYADLADVTERAVWMHEQIEQAVGSAPTAPR
jgi:hypothetical protein